MTSVRAPQDIAIKVLGLVEASGGATVETSNLSSPEHGYAVALQGHEQLVELSAWGSTVAETRAVITLAVEAFVDRHRALLSWPGIFLGAWLDKGTLYLDIVKVHASRDSAEDHGRLASQLAIFHLDTGETITL